MPGPRNDNDSAIVPSSGVLPKVASAVGLVAVDFGVAGDAVMRMFDTLASGLVGRGGLAGYGGPWPVDPKCGPWVGDAPPGRGVSGGRVGGCAP